MNQITLTGMVTASAPVGEYDRRVVLLTKERGKVAAFARGARRPNSALVGVTGPFTFGTFTLYEGRTSYTLTSASVSSYFEELRTDMEGACYGFYFLEFANYYAREANDETQLLKLLYQSLRALINPNLNNRLVRRVFELKAVSIEGEGPRVFDCVICGDREKEKRFSVRRGGLVCADCLDQAPDAVPLHPSALYAMQFAVSSPVERLYTFAVKPEVLKQLEEIMDAYLEVYVDRKFKSLEILETIAQ